METLKVRDIVETSSNSAGTDALLGRFVAKSSRALWIISHVDYATGAVLPISEMTKRIRQSSADHIILIDGAHGPGNIPVQLKSCLLDAYAFCGHKWLMGTPGSGFLWVADRWRERVSELEYEGPELPEAKKLCEAGKRTPYSRATLAMEAFISCDAYLALVEVNARGWSELLRQQREMRALLAGEVMNAGSLTVICGLATSAIVAFRPEGILTGKGPDIIQQCDSAGIVGRYLPMRDLCRFCVPYFVDETEIKGVGRKLTEIRGRFFSNNTNLSAAAGRARAD